MKQSCHGQKGCPPGRKRFYVLLCRFKISKTAVRRLLCSANGQILTDMTWPVVLRFQMPWRRRKQRKLEGERDSVKDRMVSLSNCFHFSTQLLRRNKPCRFQLEQLPMSPEPNSSPVFRGSCLAIFSYFNQKKNCFQEIFSNSNILFRNQGVVTFNFLQKKILLHVQLK